MQEVDYLNERVFGFILTCYVGKCLAGLSFDIYLAFALPNDIAPMPPPMRLVMDLISNCPTSIDSPIGKTQPSTNDSSDVSMDCCSTGRPNLTPESSSLSAKSGSFIRPV